MKSPQKKTEVVEIVIRGRQLDDLAVVQRAMELPDLEAALLYLTGVGKAALIERGKLKASDVANAEYLARPASQIMYPCQELRGAGKLRGER